MNTYQVKFLNTSFRLRNIEAEKCLIKDNCLVFYKGKDIVASFPCQDVFVIENTSELVNQAKPTDKPINS
jgi:hypothetical protein